MIACTVAGGGGGSVVTLSCNTMITNTNVRLTTIPPQINGIGTLLSYISTTRFSISLGFFSAFDGNRFHSSYSFLGRFCHPKLQSKKPYVVEESDEEPPQEEEDGIVESDINLEVAMSCTDRTEKVAGRGTQSKVNRAVSKGSSPNYVKEEKVFGTKGRFISSNSVTRAGPYASRNVATEPLESSSPEEANRYAIVDVSNPHEHAGQKALLMDNQLDLCRSKWKISEERFLNLTLLMNKTHVLNENIV
ncbi:hypothetical protein L2E82_29642 [Cichorium intybus]|uniref:Uncharacterized protein n=1 Tax=Cichorium intybus TaxID=13427 RepID=A0ACB9CYI0_CICIN|nr:hypothetical protein L2E82_29642 [Cichorium intybus]